MAPILLIHGKDDTVVQFAREKPRTAILERSVAFLEKRNLPN